MTVMIVDNKMYQNTDLSQLIYLDFSYNLLSWRSTSHKNILLIINMIIKPNINSEVLF